MLKKLLVALILPLTLVLTPVRPAPAHASASTGPAGAVWHVVKPGETMRSIARLHGLRSADIGRWNQIVPPYPVHVDETLRLTEPASPLRAWRTHWEMVTPGMVNWNPAARCPTPPANLRRVWVSYLDLNGAYHDGSIIVRKDVVLRTQKIFFTLFRWRFRIMAMAPMRKNMPGQTDMSIVTAGYNCRPVSGTHVWSQHAYGLAIDINPLQNPMIRGPVINPAAGSFYLNRGSHLIGMVHAEGAVRAFTQNSFYWGGGWTSVKDYMHFSLTNK